jgi:hypothetical protein
VPVTYRIDKAHGIIRTRCTGAVTLEEVIGHFHQLERDPECPSHLDVLLDLSGETSIPTTEYLREITTEIARIRNKVQFGICAIAATTDALYGMLRMFQVVTEPYFREACVFRTVHEAETWLASKQPTASEAG